MSFLKNIFGKKQGGSFLGNLIAGAANKLTGGALGAKRVAALQSGDIAAINPGADKKGSLLKSVEEDQALYFAGQPATFDSSTQTYNMQEPLNQVTVQAVRSENTALDKLVESIGDPLSKLVGKATENATVGADNKTLLVVGGSVALLIVAMFATRK